MRPLPKTFLHEPDDDQANICTAMAVFNRGITEEPAEEQFSLVKSSWELNYRVNEGGYASISSQGS
jgi:hypothetical protein